MKAETLVHLLTWNIQAGIGTRRYRDYLFHAHRQLVHTAAKTAVLHAIAREITRYDVVCLQEIDLGGRRAGYRSQIEEIARHSGHHHVEVQQNRVVPGISRHGNAVLSRWPLQLVADMKLPGRVGGRGCLIVDVLAPEPLRVACLHLSLGARDQQAQLAVVAQALQGGPRWVAMGDFNCGAASAPLRAFCQGAQPAPSPATYPSWRPRHDYDHIVGGPGLILSRRRVEAPVLSDHLAVSAQILPG